MAWTHAVATLEHNEDAINKLIDTFTHYVNEAYSDDPNFPIFKDRAYKALYLISGHFQSQLCHLIKPNEPFNYTCSHCNIERGFLVITQTLPL